MARSLEEIGGVPGGNIIREYLADKGMVSWTVTLTSAQVLACFTTPVEIVPAQGTGIITVPVLYVCTHNFLTGGYTVGGSIQAGIGASAPTNFLATLASAKTCLQAGATTEGMDSGIVANTGTPANMENKSVWINSTTSNPTAGAGSLKVTTYFVKHIA